MKKKVIKGIVIIVSIICVLGLIIFINRMNSIKITDKEGKVYYAREGKNVNISNCNLKIISIEENQVVIENNGKKRVCKYGEEIDIYDNYENDKTGEYIYSFRPIQTITFEK